MERISVKEYARKHKLSLFQVIKKINSGELRSESVEENGSRVQYILLDQDREAPAESETAAKESENAARRVNPNEERLLLEVQSLRAELRALRKIVEECCKQSS